MEPIEPAYGSVALLLIAAAAVALLLILIMVVRLHAMISLVLVSVITAVAAGIPIGDVPDALFAGFSETLGEVALLVGFGVMLGRLLEVTGGAQVLADTLISRFGEKRAPFALGVAALLFGFPIFFDAGLVVFLPIIFTVARRFGGSLLLYAFPAAGGFAAMHALVPPHPGPVAAGVSLGGDIGVILLVGVPTAVIAWYFGSYLFSQAVGRRVHVDVPTVLFGEENGGEEHQERSDADAPPFALVLGLLLLPMVLISFNTLVSTLIESGTLDESTLTGILLLVGNTPVALLITLLVAIVVLGRRGRTYEETTSVLDDALGPICSIILITGAGGMFGGVLYISGIGEALTTSLEDIGMPVLAQAFVIATALRVAQGSATVALTTTAGVIAAPVAEEGFGDFRIALLVVAIAAGATVLSHVNDSGFWLVSRFFQMDEKQTLRTWTVMETTIGLTAFAVAVVLWGVAGAVGV
ncbi:GntP family permease [Nocardioides bizhenqiangii]|uniref:GntP family permease n=1 Tax=Nocardioides bizhenqiangii TaxID=3095076 RepID=A0ABZ0ZVG6_9ACTN|nr:GntP family permease [Nocardioides sp. HM61]WQQ28233.1 GntP family permease [Nocardioides sp. HM61]